MNESYGFIFAMGVRQLFEFSIASNEHIIMNLSQRKRERHTHKITVKSGREIKWGNKEDIDSGKGSHHTRTITTVFFLSIVSFFLFSSI